MEKFVRITRGGHSHGGHSHGGQREGGADERSDQQSEQGSKKEGVDGGTVRKRKGGKEDKGTILIHL